MAVVNERPFVVNIASSGPMISGDDKRLCTKQERNGMTKMTALVATILGTFYQSMSPSPFETHYKVVVGTLVVVLIYMVTSMVHSLLNPAWIFHAIIGDIELFSQILFVPLFLLMLVPRLGLISLVLLVFSLPIWIATKYFSGWLYGPWVLWDQVVVAVRSILEKNYVGPRPPV